MPYIIAPARDVKGPGQYPEYLAVLKAVQDAAIARAADIWKGWVPGGLTPKSNQFGIGLLRKNDTSNDVTTAALSGSYSYSKTLTATGWVPLFSYTVPDDTIHAYAGFSFVDEVMRISQIRLEIQDRILPIIDLQGAWGWGKFDVLIKEDVGGEFVAQGLQRVLVQGYVESTGPQRIVPIGLHLYKNLTRVITQT